MCTALQELEDTGRREGRIEGIIEGIVKTCMEFGATEEETAEKLQRQCGLGEKAARKYVVRYYQHEINSEESYRKKDWLSVCL